MNKAVCHVGSSESLQFSIKKRMFAGALPSAEQTQVTSNESWQPDQAHHTQPVRERSQGQQSV